MDLTHAPSAKRSEDFVGTEFGAGGEVHLIPVLLPHVFDHADILIQDLEVSKAR